MALIGLRALAWVLGTTVWAISGDDTGARCRRVSDGSLWHTLTGEELGVDLLVRLRNTLTLYDFVCRIPGHPEAGMTGPIVVQSIRAGRA